MLQWKAKSITYSECVFVASVTQRAKGMRHIILSSVACLTLPICRHYLINGKIIGMKVIELKICVYIINVHRSSYKIPFILSDFN